MPLRRPGTKLTALSDCHRILAPGGSISLYDWTRIEGPPSEDMLCWIQLEGLTYAMETLARYGELLEEAGLVDVQLDDGSDWYRRKVVEEYRAIKGHLMPEMIERMGREQAEHFVENWLAMVVVCKKGEMRQGWARATKPQ